MVDGGYFLSKYNSRRNKFDHGKFFVPVGMHMSLLQTGEIELAIYVK